jgi:hypothetical protein
MQHMHPAARRAYYALGHQRDGRPNKTEAAYEAILKAKALSGEIKHYAYESLKLRLADKTFYTPDFVVLNNHDQLEIHEVKGGFITDDSMVKLKVAAEMHPFRFFLARKENKNWHVEEV